MSFAFHAQAIGLSARLKKPLIENIPGLVGISLSQTGGESYATVSDFNWKGLITFDEASAYVNGSENAPDQDGYVYNTLSTVTVRNLNVANMVHADLVVARVSSRHKKARMEGDVTEEGEIVFTGSMIRNLTIAGETVDVSLDDTPFRKEPTHAGFAANMCGKPDTAPFVEKHGDLITASLISQPISCRSSDGINRYVVHIPDFGKIYVAQVIIKPNYRRVSMLRFELGSPVGGSVEVCGGETNGSEYWP